jgi:phosphatidylglycerophosphatase A
MKDFVIKLFATGIFTGYLKPFPGTWGTIPAWLIAWFFIKGDQAILWPVIVVCTVLSIAFSSLAEKKLGHDSRKIVIDEWAGMFVALLYVPYSLSMYASAFIAFRVFDVIKIWPARQSESLPGGVGITADDIIAGAQTAVFIHLIIYVSRTFFA